MIRKLFNQIIWNYHRNRSPKVMHGVHDEDLEKVLADLGSLELIREGGVKCLVCGDVVALENLGGWIARETGQQYLCDKDNCLFQVGKLPSEGQ